MGNRGQNLKEQIGNNLIGVVILGLGALALIMVGYLAYQKLYSSDVSDKVQQNDVDLFKKAGRVANRAAGEKPTSEKTTYKRQKSISEKEISGAWQARLKNEKALLEMKKGKYRLIIIPNKASKKRYYSNGDYKIQDGIVMLMPDLNRGPPESETFKYSVLTRSKMPLMAVKYKGKLIWQVPPRDIKIYVPPYHPVLNRAEDKIVVWSVLE